MHALYPHLKGRTSLEYSPCGKYLFTVGENMMVRRFLVGSPQDEPETIELDFNAHDVATKPSGFAVCGDSGVAELYDAESRQKIHGLVRTALPLRQISFSSDGQWVGIVGDDCCRIVNAEDITKTHSINLQNTRALSFHPTNSNVVAFSGLDGTVRVRDVLSNSEISTIEAIVPSISDFADDRSTSAAWSPQGECMALPTKTFDVALISTRDWLIALRLSGGHANAITTLRWSPNGRYIASGGRDDKVLVWNVEKRSIVQSYDVVGVLEVRWHPHNNEMSFVTVKGQLYTVTEVIPDNLYPPFGGDPIDALGSLHTNSNNSHNALGNVDLGGDNLNADNDGNIRSDEDLFVSDDVGAGEYTRGDRPRKRYDDFPEEAEDAMVQGRSYPEHSHRYRGQENHKRTRVDLGPQSTVTQQPFQSGSTPWLSQKRYLCMSPVGYIWSVRNPGSHNSTTITFFDQSVHREVHFHDRDQFDLAALSSQAAIFAQSGTGKVAVRFHSSLSDNWETQVDIDIDGGVQCVALSSEVAVVFTKRGFMRTYTLYGTPLAVSRVGSGCATCSLVTVSAFGNEVIAVHHQHGAYTYTYEDVAQGKLFQTQSPLGLAPGAKITSLFFSEDGEPCFMDSSGVLSTLLHGRTAGQARWVPVFSPPRIDQEVQRKYWPLGVLESKLLCIVLKGQQQFPSIPMPITDEVDLSTPGLPEAESHYLVSRTQFEQLQDRIEYATSQLGVEISEEDQEALTDQAIELDKMLLRQFQQACQDQRLNRGLQIVQLIRTPESLQAAAKVAAAYELKTLASRILEAIE